MGKDKGNRGERMAAEVVSAWTGKEFKKIPRGQGHFTQYSNPAMSDIICVTEGHYFPFSVEVKFYSKVDFSHLLVPGIKNIDILDWWEQTKTTAKNAGKVPMLLIRYNRLPKDFFFMVLEAEYVAEILKNVVWLDKKPFIKVFAKKERLVILNSRNFFKLPYKDIKKITKTYLNAKKKIG